MQKKFLIADQDVHFAQKLKSTLSERSVDCTVVRYGRDAQSQIAKEDYNAIILDYGIQNFSAPEVLTFIKTKNPFMRVFLLFNDQKSLDNTEILKKKSQLGITDVFVKDADLNLMLNSMLSTDSSKVWKDLLGEVKDKTNSNLELEALEFEDSEFFPFSLSLLQDCESAALDTFIRLGPGKYILLIKKGENLSSERFSRYANQDVEVLYYRTSDRMELIKNLSSELASTTAASVQKKPEKAVETIASTMEFMLDELITNGFHPEQVKMAESLVNKTNSFIKEFPSIESLLLQLHNRKDIMKAHSIMATALTSLACQNLEWVSPKLAEEFLLGAFIQNIGLVRLGIVSLNFNPEMSEEQKSEFKSHPILGYRFLQNYPISEKVRQIVLQHHESCDGTGFPFGIRFNNIFPPARIVFAASELATLMLNHKLSVKASLEQMIRDPGNREKYDPEVIKALIKALTKKR